MHASSLRVSVFVWVWTYVPGRRRSRPIENLNPYSRAVVRNLRACALLSIEPTVCSWPTLCSLESARGGTRVPFRIHRSSARDAVVLALSGDIDREHVARLHQFLTSDTGRRLILDLQNVTLVDRAAIQFLAGAEATGIRLVNCPEYVRTWIAAEQDSPPQPTPEPDTQE